ncbi:TPA: PsaF/MyfF family fimbrial adhesin regulatory protein [Escherichia coli]
MKKKLAILSTLSLIIALPICNLNNNIELHSERKIFSIEEHTDLDINGMRFNISHYISTEKKTKLITSESISGIALRTSVHGYYLIPTHKYITSKNGSFEAMGNIYSICAYHIKNKSNNTVIFFDEKRAVLSIDETVIQLPTCFLGEKKQAAHPNQIT